MQDHFDKKKERVASRGPDEQVAGRGLAATLVPAAIAVAVGVMAAVGTPKLLYLPVGVFFFAWFVAYVLFQSSEHREKLASFTEDRDYDQIYQMLVGGLVRLIWSRMGSAVSSPAERFQDGNALRTTLRDAASAWMYDRALVIAFLYLLLMPVGTWLVSGQAVGIGAPGSPPILNETPFWPDRITLIGLFTAFTLLLFQASWASAHADVRVCPIGVGCSSMRLQSPSTLAVGMARFISVGYRTKAQAQ